MNHFHPKSLTFYAIAIASVLLLFKVVTIFGENNLQASPVLNNSYSLSLNNKIPECQTSPPLKLNIQQSGIYINASLLPVQTNADIPARYPLKGTWNNQQLTLSGKVDQTVICNIAPPHHIQAQMQLIDDRQLRGKIIISTIAQNLEFNATPVAAQAEPKKSHSQ